MLKSEPRRYDAIALRDSRIVFVPRNTFTLLLDGSVAFNRFILIQLNERLGHFIGMVEYDRSLGPNARLAKELAALSIRCSIREAERRCPSRRRNWRTWSGFLDNASTRR